MAVKWKVGTCRKTGYTPTGSIADTRGVKKLEGGTDIFNSISIQRCRRFKDGKSLVSRVLRVVFGVSCIAVLLGRFL